MRGKRGEGKFAIVDLDDIPKIETVNTKWSLKGADGNDYAGTKYQGKMMNLHRLIMDFPKLTVDHINQDRLDNRKANLRLATMETQSRNRRKSKARSSNPQSKYPGVSWNKGAGKWQVLVQHDGKRNRHGYYTSEVAAARVAYSVRKGLDPGGDFSVYDDIHEHVTVNKTINSYFEPKILNTNE